MNTIFAIRKDIPDYQVLDLDLMDVTRDLPDDIDLDSVYDFSQLNTSMTSWWKTPETRYIDTNQKNKSETPDISCWVDASLVLTPKAFRLLKDSLAPHGEFLPVMVAQELHYIFNCFTFGKADENSCVFNNEEGMQAGLKHLEFDQTTANLIVFKAEIENGLTLFCSSRFKEIVESFDLHGIVFDTNLIVS